MTKQKQLKRLVRARMQKTGERYAAARRHVVAQAVLPPAAKGGAGAGVDADGALRWHLPGSVPATNALRVALAAAGVLDPETGQPFSEALLFGIAGGVGAGVFAFHYEKEGFSSFFVAGRRLWQDDRAYLTEAATRFGLEPRVLETAGAAAARKHLDGALAEGRPVVAWVDHGSLPHRGNPPHWVGGGYHVVSVYEASEDEVVFGDLTDVPMRLERGVFEAARARIKKQKNRVLALPPAAEVPDLETLLRSGLASCVEGLTRSRLRNFTLEAFADWAARLRSKGKDGWPRVFPRGSRLWQGLSSVHDFIEHYGTGGGLSRPLMAECLAQAAERLGDEPWRGLARRYAELGRGWSDLADAALPDDVPLLAEGKALLGRKAELLAGGEPQAPEQVRSLWGQLDELAGRAAHDFPLDEAGCEELCAELERRLLKLVAAERDALAALESALG